MNNVSFGITSLLAVANGSSNVALVSFCVYLAAVVLLAWFSSRSASTSSFVSEYFLGGKSLGVWAFALTFAATAASGGSFVGFPALIYSHGWVLALWIAGYMLVPLVAMGLFGKRLNRVGRQADALTIPEVLSKRFDDPKLGAVASVLTVFFIFIYLIAQFKAGSTILGSLLRGVHVFDVGVGFVQSFTRGSTLLSGVEPGQFLCLIIFAVAVIGYVVYGGFRAVVWTDVMQGMVMFFGVLVMLVLALQQVGGLKRATTELADRLPPVVAEVRVETSAGGPPTDVIRKGTWLRTNDGRLSRLSKSYDAANANVDSTELVRDSDRVNAIVLTNEKEFDQVDPEIVAESLVAVIVREVPYVHGHQQKGVYVTVPGPSRDKASGFLGIVAAFSFFAFWTFSGAGQPSNMVRLMAFKDTRTLRRSIITVAFYFSFIYFSLVVVFCIAKVLMPGMEYDADRAMPDFAVFTTDRAGIPWLAGLLLAAPFAAVMSSVDSFLLLVSSSLVRDIYQRIIHPDATEKQLKAVTYGGTIAIGVAATLGTIFPPPYLQELIIAASAGLSSTFLVPIIVSLYWRRMNSVGAMLGMIGGFGSQVVLMSKKLGILLLNEDTSLGNRLADLTGIDTFLWNVGVALFCVIVGSLVTRPPNEDLIRRYFD
jgi:Na+/proline symporter